MAVKRIMNVERLELVEERLGVALNGVVAEVGDADDEGECRIEVRGEVTALNGGALSHSIQVKMTAFNAAGDCLATGSFMLPHDNFFGIDAFRIGEYAISPDIQRVRVFVTKI